MKKLVLVFGLGLVVAIIGMVFMTDSIMTRKAEAVQLRSVATNIAANEGNNYKFKDAYPRQFHSWTQTKTNDQKTDTLAQHPAQVIIFGTSGMGKSREGTRGHHYSMIDLYDTIRAGTNGVRGTCVGCHSSDVPRLIEKFGEDGFFAGKEFDFIKETANPVGCANCHDTQTMALKITVPFAADGIREMGKDPENLSYQELRTFVCTQCHSEYYTKRNEHNVAKLVIPYEHFLNVDAMEKFFDEKGQIDYTHSLSKTPLLRAQHAEAGMAMNGIHYERGVSCADCHMPYEKEGGVKFTSHDIKSPVERIEKTCATCHRESEKTLMSDINNRMKLYDENVVKVEAVLADTHLLVKKALDAGAKVEELKSIHDKIRTAQWRWDYVASAKGSFFHAPLESMRLVLTALDNARAAKEETIVLLHKMGITDLSLPDYSSKEKAGAIVGLDYEKMGQAQAKHIKEKVVPALEKAVSEGLLDKRQYEGHKFRFTE